ncbi:hypothetical protein FLAG1_07354 [Fusarium langsethiae]|uniref:Fucose-specific lectin n=1 Tax=Fusarium langsethiae TaxID=179993 RepID=A0A0M9ETU7_FUSLA|nr:hypothetical protein FLAG1_07354 [Fusarium langsethiae]GKU05448.1 unnamed protein product [Fusarium langsethiae]GKU20977.1 unnamed protein product [Fusarium langsethiae]
MSRSTIASTLAIAGLFAEPVVGLAGWWTWSPETLTPHFAYQDPGSGNILHSSCNSNGSAAFSTDNPNKFPVKSQPKAATPLAVTGWWDDDLNTPIASIFYQATDDSIINAFFTCDNKTGNYKLNPDGNDVISDLASAPSVHEKTGLAVTELGDSGGYRLYYHDEDGLVSLLAYDDDTDWRYDGPVSLKKAGGMAIATLQTQGTNVSVAYPYDSKTIAVARFNNENKNKWSLESFPTLFDSPAPTNKTDPSDIRLDSSEGGSFQLSSFDSAANLGLAASTSQQLSVFYIGEDAELHAVSDVDGSWEEQETPGKKKWPHADIESGRLAVVSPLESEEIWVYYTSGDKVMELHRDRRGTWSDARTPSLNSATNANDSEGSDGNDDSEGDDSNGGSGSSKDATQDNSSSSTGITTGAKAGIGVGVGVGVLAVAAAAFFFLRRRRQRAATNERKDSVGELASRNSYHDLQTEVHQAQEMPLTTPPQQHELLGDTRHRDA